MNILNRVSSERWLLAGSAVALGLVVLAWNQWVRDDDDAKWTAPPWTDVDQPPRQVGAELGDCKPLCPGSSKGRPMDPGESMRTRAYPGNLASANFSIIGEF